MNKTTRRALPALAALAVGTVALTGCASGDSGDGSSDSNEDITLNTLFLDTDVYTPCVTDYIDKFTEETGIKVNIQSEGFSGYHDKLLTTLSSGSDTYDLTMIAYQWTGEFAPFMVPITDKVAADADALGGILPASTDTYVFNGEQYAIPFTAQAETLFYRTDLFEQAGLEPPKTWDDVADIEKFFTNNPDYPGVYGISVKAASSHAQTMFDNRYYGLGGEALGEPGSEMDVTAAAKALQQLKDDATVYSPPGALAATFAEVSAQLAGGTVAMAELMPTTVLGLVDTEGDSNKVFGKIGATTVPGGHGEAGGWGLAVNNTSKHQDAAYELATYLTSEDADLGCYTEYGKPAVQQATYDNDEVKSAWQTEGILDALSSSIGKARGATAAQINGMMDETVSRFLAGQAGSADDAAQEMADRYEELVNQ
ncbi:extracellular solute-binding protein [Compostimonas suwonensis]|uniref:ABC-type glycerol-3-phosphate transport system substrate-binding protein n=1 Tax=Compostimonas suwonensis TaxID=1048394 RepID=A0A2M9BB95_9MICO|nr:extracellular solute-binding protein [Compostimonas suwonensis]PJJ55214.1 ABC-type glycerol-3-phosphate transport system substrate-binding protein [Compostimonas suwonensis]